MLLNRETSVSSKSIMRERIRNLLTTFFALIDQLTGSLHQDHQTSEILSTLKPRPITGSMKIDFGTRRIEITKSREPKSTCSKVLFFHLTFLVLKQSSLSSTTKWLPELDISEIPTRNSISLSCHQVRSSKPLGTVKSSSLEDLQYPRSENPTLFLQPPFLIKNPLPLFQMPVTPASWYAPPSAPTWVAFPYHISVLIRAGFAFVTDPSMTNSVESDKVQHKLTCLTSTTLYTDQSSALRSKSSPTSLPFSSMSERSWWNLNLR